METDCEGPKRDGFSTAARSGAGGDSLTRRAALTSANGLIEQATRVVTGLVVTPIVVRMLGIELYGAWSMIGQLQSNLATTDFRASGTLKVLLMLEQHTADDGRKRRMVGAALVLWACSLGLLVAVGAVLVGFAPSLIKTSEPHHLSVRLALGLVLLAMGISQLGGIPSNMLRGANLDYKAVGLRSVIGLAASFLGLFAVLAGWGLPGLAAAGVMSAAVMGALWLHLARRHVGWCGVERPHRTELKGFMQNSAWFVVVNQGQALVLASDIFLVGFLLGPAAAGVYSATGMLIRLGVIPVINLLASTTPGLVGLCGKGEWGRVADVTRQIVALNIVGACAVGTVAIVLNEAVLGRLLGPEFVADRWLTVLLVVLQIVQCLYRVEATLIDGVRAFRVRALRTLVGGLIGVLLAWGFSRFWGAHGIAIGMICGVIIATLALARATDRLSGLEVSARYGASAWLAVVALLLLGGSVGVHPPGNSWPVLIASAAVLGVVVLGALIFVGMRAVEREQLVRRVRGLWPRLAGAKG